MNLTSKELAAIEDQLSSEATIVKKYRMYAQTCSDSQLKSKYEQIASQHQRHFDRLFSQLG